MYLTFNLRGSSGLVRSRPVVGAKEMLAAEDSLDLGQVWDSGNTRLEGEVETIRDVCFERFLREQANDDRNVLTAG